MSELARNAAKMMDMLPAAEQALAYEMIKRIVLAWDPDFTRLTDEERELVESAEAEMECGESISHEEIDWNA